MPGKLLGTLALLQVSHTATPSHMFAQRAGNLRRQEEGGTAGASRFKLKQFCHPCVVSLLLLNHYSFGYQNYTVLDVRILC